MSDGIELKPCPFCHAQAKVIGYVARQVICSGCGARGSEWHTTSGAIEAWNTRPTAPVGNEGAAILKWIDDHPKYHDEDFGPGVELIREMIERGDHLAAMGGWQS